MTYFNNLKGMASFIIILALAGSIILSIVFGIFLIFGQGNIFGILFFFPILIFPAFGTILDFIWDKLGYEL